MSACDQDIDNVTDENEPRNEELPIGDSREQVRSTHGDNSTLDNRGVVADGSRENETGRADEIESVESREDETGRTDEMESVENRKDKTGRADEIESVESREDETGRADEMESVESSNEDENGDSGQLLDMNVDASVQDRSERTEQSEQLEGSSTQSCVNEPVHELVVKEVEIGELQFENEMLVQQVMKLKEENQDLK